MLAKLTKVSELELDDAEAARLGEAVARVNALYGGVVLSDKQLAWINLATTAGGIYAPRAMAFKLRMQQEEEKRNGGPVVDVQGSPIAVQ